MPICSKCDQPITGPYFTGTEIDASGERSLIAHPACLGPGLEAKPLQFRSLGLDAVMVPHEPVRDVQRGPTIDNVELVDQGGSTVLVRLSYPRTSPKQHLEIDLSDVRAADGIRVHYDFSRDGWAIEQASTFEWEVDGDGGDDLVCNPDWQEVVFVKAWARETEPPARKDPHY